MDPTPRRLQGLRPPAGGDIVTVGVSSDIGGEAALAAVSDRLTDLTIAVGLGEKWGAELARAAARWDLRYDWRNGERRERLFDEAAALGYSRDEIYDELEWHPRRWPGQSGELMRSLADVRTPPLLGRPTVVHRVEYSNPLELVLAGSGMLIGGVIWVARLVRDWSNKRRADEAVVREAHAEATITETRAELYKWLVDEAKQGRCPMPVGDLAQLVTPAEIKALDRLADSPLRLELPPGTGPG